MPKVSVITCTYNRAHLIGETIQSVLDQTWSDFEFIIVDDGSTDHTEEVIHSFNDNRIQYFKLPHSKGHLSKLRNYSHSKSNGEYIAYIDSDDLWVKNKLELQLSELEQYPEIGFSFTDVQLFDKTGVLKSSIYFKSGNFRGSVFPLMLRNELVICHPSLVFRKKCMEKIGPMDEAMHSGDHDFAMFLSRYFDAFVIYQPLVRVRRHDQNSTSSEELSLKLMREHHYTLKKLFDQNLITQREYSMAYGLTSYSFAIQLIPSRNILMIRYYLKESIKSQPLKWKAWIRLLLTYLKR